MTTTNSTSSPEELAQMVEDCEKRESRLDDWQRSFIDSISRQLSEGRGLTARQAAMLGDVWDIATAKG